jgi:hypothetical protein
MTNSNLVPAQFTFDGEGTPMLGLHNPTRFWNGWAMPLISAESMPNLVSQMNVDFYQIDYIEGGRVTIFFQDDCDVVVDYLEPIEIEGKIYYDFAWLGYTFATIDYEESLHQEARDLMDAINDAHKWDSQLSLDEYLMTHFDGLSDAEINDIKTLLDKFDNL